MFTHHVRTILRTSYGIQDIPSELLEYFIAKKKRQVLREDTLAPAATVAFCIANDWQRGLSTGA